MQIYYNHIIQSKHSLIIFFLSLITYMFTIDLHAIIWNDFGEDGIEALDINSDGVLNVLDVVKMVMLMMIHTLTF